VDTLIVLLQGCSIGIFLALAILLYLDHLQLLAGRFLLALLVCNVAYLFEPFLPNVVWLEWGVRILAAMVTPFYWLFASALFLDWDYKRTGPSHRRTLIVACYVAVIVATMVLHWIFPDRWPLAQTASYYVGYLFRLAILAATLHLTLDRWRQDMVEARRRLRLLIVFSGVSLTVLNTVIELGYRDVGSPMELKLLHAVLLLILSLWLSIWLQHQESGGLARSAGEPPRDETDASPGPSAVVSIPAKEERLLALNDYIVNQKGYRETGLSIGYLGKQLQMPEHLLRKLINQGLGYRNFSDFLNNYRIADTVSRLDDPAQNHWPILTLALDAGYASLAPFNRAFKEKMGQTPSEYRRQQLAGPDSSL
jgi:AraC-like DNA-binding protein